MVDSDDLEPREPPDRRVIFGLNVCSEVRLADRPAVAPPSPQPTDVVIRFERLAGLAPSAVSSALRVDGGDARLDVENVGRYRIGGGEEIGVDPAPGVSLRTLRTYLLGPVFGILFHHRRMLPMHASAIVVRGSAVLFAGNRGVGKSTLAAYFDARGYPALADDICVLSLEPDGRVMAWPDLRRLKLRRDAVQRFGYQAAELVPTADNGQKFYVPVSSPVPSGGVPLSCVYALQDASAESGSDVSRLTGLAAIETVAANTFAASYLAHTKMNVKHLNHWTRIAQHVPIFAARRRRGFDAFVDEAAQLERHFTRPASSVS